MSGHTAIHHASVRMNCWRFLNRAVELANEPRRLETKLYALAELSRQSAADQGGAEPTCGGRGDCGAVDLPPKQVNAFLVIADK